MLKTFKQLLNSQSVDEQVVLFRKLNSFALQGQHLAELVQFLYTTLPENPLYPINALDIVGTGGDAKGTFNISTTTALLLAKRGIPIAKHGSVSVSSHSGSVDCLHALGIECATTQERAQYQLINQGHTFMFARDFYPILGQLRTARLVLRESGEKTIINLLGPLLNPLHPRYQVIGVYEPSLLQPMAEAMSELNREGFVVTSEGTDELTLSSDHHILEVRTQGKIKPTQLDLPTLGFNYADIKELAGGTPERNAKIANEILTGNLEGPKYDVVAANALLGERAYYGT